MQKKDIRILVFIVLIISLLFGGYFYKRYFIDQDGRKIEVKIHDYSFLIANASNYTYDSSTEEGHFKRDDIPYSSIYMSDLSYDELVDLSEVFVNSGSREVTTDTKETSIKNYKTFINTKEVYYSDIDKSYNLNIIIVDLGEDGCLVICFEVKNKDNNWKVLQDVKTSLEDLSKNN